ncbi:nuclear transport factor 2 family protein [Olivibacter sp. SDN3]|uniref:nuclear transport factor 2 family protein n=1 Tax=Olivibacter sp. SDN3 TaxID=2764720 RepID=UPI0016519951|nr:nuclear transport factor 2 family protein [Olivibacter sp. SDN3]QNL49608.1 nuclear transport factor 2 family protein [Olivibacter sp. SDN3]
MKKNFMALCCLIIASITQAQTTDEKKLLKTLDDLYDAMIRVDTQVLSTIAADNLSYWHSGGNHEDKAEFIQALTSGKSDFISIDLSDQTFKISDKVATVHHVLSAETNDNGNPGNVRIGVLLVFQKYGDQWKLFARQAFKLPESS